MEILNKNVLILPIDSNKVIKKSRKVSGLNNYKLKLGYISNFDKCLSDDLMKFDLVLYRERKTILETDDLVGSDFKYNFVEYQDIVAKIGNMDDNTENLTDWLDNIKPEDFKQGDE